MSNDGMLEILSETENPLRVQPYLKSCFEGIAKLGFDKSLNIYSMFSDEGEEVHYVSNISTKEAGGRVELWLIQVSRSGKIHFFVCYVCLSSHPTSSSFSCYGNTVLFQ